MGQVGTGWTGTGSIMGIDPVPGQGQASSVGIEPVPGTRTASSVGQPLVWVYNLSMGQGTGLFWPFPVPVGQVWYRQHACTMRLYQTCPTGTGRVNLPHWDRHFACPTLPKSALDKVWGLSLSKTQRGPNRITEIPYQKSVSNWSKTETKNRKKNSLH